MMNKDLLKNILSDVRVEMLDEFTRNFERKAFFDEPWVKRKRAGKGSLLMISGRLRRSLHADISGRSVRFSSDCEYAAIHNGGGTINVTPKMRKYFWFRYMQAKAPEDTVPVKGSQAQIWSYMARAKKITIPARPFIGNHPTITRTVKEIANERIKEWLNNKADEISKHFNR